MTSELIDYITQIKGFENSPDKFYQVVISDNGDPVTEKLFKLIVDMFKNDNISGRLKPQFIFTSNIVEIRGEND